MSSQVLVNAKLWCAGFDWTGDVNVLALKAGADMIEKTNFGSAGFRERLPGLKFFSFQHDGFVNPGANLADDAIFNTVFAVKNSVMSIDPQGAGVEGDFAYTGQVDLVKYSPAAPIGKMFGFQIAGDGDGAPLVRGQLMANRTVTVTGNGTAFQLGAVGATQKVYASLHVLRGVSGTAPTLNVKLQSAPASNFAAPTDRITFSQAIAAGAQWGAPASGAITDTWWRAVWTLGGTTPSFPFVVVAGIITP